MTKDWDRVKETIERYQDQILAIPGVVGLSSGVQRDSEVTQPCIKIYLNKPVERGNLEDNKIPKEIDGIPVEVVISGDIVAFG